MLLQSRLSRISSTLRGHNLERVIGELQGLARLRDNLLTHGRAASTPVALVENGSRPQQRVVAGTLSTLPEFAKAHAVQAPALLIIGEVAAFATRLHWFGEPPLTALDARCQPPLLAHAA